VRHPYDYDRFIEVDADVPGACDFTANQQAQTARITHHLIIRIVLKRTFGGPGQGAPGEACILAVFCHAFYKC
jgi:hypothetical protein